MRALVNDLLAGRNSEPPVVECHVATLLLDYIIIQNFCVVVVVVNEKEESFYLWTQWWREPELVDVHLDKNPSEIR